MKAVFKHELSIYRYSLSTYVFGAFLLAFTGIGVLVYNLNASIANFEYVLRFICIIFVVLVPLLTMRILAEEKKQKTDRLLYALPISSVEVIAGKFLAMAVVYAVPTVIISFYPLIFSAFGDVYLPTSYGTILAFFLLGMTLISIGMFISSLTESQGMAAGICVAVMIFVYYSDTLANYVSSTALGALIALAVLMIIAGVVIRFMTASSLLGFGFALAGIAIAVIIYFVNSGLLENLLPNLLNKISVYERFNVFVNGVFDFTALIYYVSIIAFFLFLCIQSLEKRRYNG